MPYRFIHTQVSAGKHVSSGFAFTESLETRNSLLQTEIEEARRKKTWRNPFPLSKVQVPQLA